MPNFKPFINAYLSNRPAFFSFIRPQEASLFLAAKPEHLQPPILDFGCGDGFFANLIFNPKEIKVGLDLENSRIKEGRQVYQSLKTYDGVTIPLPDQSIQTVISNCVLEHLPNLTLNLKEIYRILKPGGFFAVTVMTDQWEPNLLGGKILGEKYLAFFRRRQDHLNLFSQTQWDKSFSDTGFRIINTTGYLHPKVVVLNELCHYLSLPTLMSYKLTGKWILVPQWHRPFGLVNLIYSIIKNDCSSSANASALFYLLQK